MNKGHDDMTCADAREQFAMLLYGELSFDEEERVESHLDGCEPCRAALIKEKAIHASFDSVEIEPAPSMLRACREDLRSRLMDEKMVPASTRSSWWATFTKTLTWRPAWSVLQPVGALALIAVGFLSARLMPGAFFSAGGTRGDVQAMGLMDPQASRVRYVEPSSDGRIQIVLDETRQRVVSGRLDDQKIRALLLTAAKDPTDPGLRAETVDILNSRAQSADVRDVLIYALKNDKNAGVRLKAMEGLKPFAQEQAVRGALSQVLLSDANPGLRTQAIDLLTGGSDATGGSNAKVDRQMVDRQIVDTLQQLMQRGEQQDYVRERSRRVLEAMNASVETY